MLQLLKDTDTYLDFLCNWELLVWCMALGIYLMRFMTLGLKINKKYRNLSVLITEQINLYLQMEQKPHKKEELMVANNVLKLAEDLLKVRSRWLKATRKNIIIIRIYWYSDTLIEENSRNLLFCHTSSSKIQDRYRIVGLMKICLLHYKGNTDKDKFCSPLLSQELESPFKISGVSANPVLYNIIKVVVLSAFSAVLTEICGFKLKLYKIKLKG